MKRSWLFHCMVIASLVLAACASSSAPGAVESAAGVAETASTDPLTGRWSGDWGPTAEHRNTVTLELGWDGTNLSGSVNPGPTAVQLSKASFNPGTGAIMMEADAKGHDGNMLHYMIEGKVEGNTMMGTWAHEKMRGHFKIGKN